MEEIWRDIPDCDGLYQISNFGRVRRNGTVLKASKLRSGYLGVMLSVNGRRIGKRIHRLVAEAFLDNPDGFDEVNHKDEDKTNNRVDNLEWCTHKYNTVYGTRSKKISEKLSRPVEQILDGVVVKIWPSAREAEKAGFDHGRIGMCCNGKVKRYKGYEWRWA